jgi:hypothetical protein
MDFFLRTLTARESRPFRVGDLDEIASLKRRPTKTSVSQRDIVSVRSEGVSF